MHVKDYSEVLREGIVVLTTVQPPSCKLPKHVGRHFLKLPTGEGAGGLSLGNRNIAFHNWKSLNVCYPGVHALSILFPLFIPLKRSDSGGRVPGGHVDCVH